MQLHNGYHASQVSPGSGIRVKHAKRDDALHIHVSRSAQDNQTDHVKNYGFNPIVSQNSIVDNVDKAVHSLLTQKGLMGTRHALQLGQEELLHPAIGTDFALYGH